MAAPEPSPGEVRVRVALSGVNPGDTKKRGDWLGYGMPFPRIVPHSDGSGVIDAVGQGVDRSRIGQRVWVYGAQSYSAFGTAAELTVVPAEQAVQLPSELSAEIGACLGIPGITAHRAVFGDGAVAGKTVLVHGVLGDSPAKLRVDGSSYRTASGGKLVAGSPGYRAAARTARSYVVAGRPRASSG